MTARHLTGRDRLLLWVGFFGAPAAWTGHLLIGYGYEEYACSTRVGIWMVEPLIIGLTAVFGLLAAASGFAAFLTWRAAKRDEVIDARGRVAMMGHAGMIWSPFFLVIILMAGAMLLAFDPCVPG